LLVSIWVFVLFLSWAQCVAALQVDVEAPVRDPVVGKPFPLRIIVTWKGAADEYSLLPVELPEKEAVNVVNSSMSSSRIGRTNRVEYVVELQIARKGETHLGKIPIPYRTAESEDEQSIESDPITIRVRSDPLPMQILMGTVAAGGLVGIVLLSRSVAMSRRAQREEERRVKEREETEALLDRLEQLKSLRVAGDLGGYLTGLAEIAGKCGASAAESGAYEEIKRLAERTMFDGYHPSVEELDSSYRTVRRWVKRAAEERSATADSATTTNG